jgi:hypothetical protein
MSEDILSGLWPSHVSGHLHGLVYDEGLAGSHISSSENAFGGGVAHFNRSHDVIWLASQLQVVKRRTAGNARCGFGLEKPTEVHGEKKSQRRD